MGWVGLCVFILGCVGVDCKRFFGWGSVFSGRLIIGWEYRRMVGEGG